MANPYDGAFNQVELAMAHSPRFQLSASQNLPKEVDEFGKQLKELPDPHSRKLLSLYDRVVEGIRLRTRIMNVAKEALERMRLEVACLQFDLEMTRREKDALQKQIDETQS